MPTNLVVNNTHSPTTSSSTSLEPTVSPFQFQQKYDEHELALLTNIAYPFFNQYHILKLLDSTYKWQDFILDCYNQCFIPLHYDESTKPVVCNRIAKLLWLNYKYPTKEHFSWIQLYSPYLALVPSKVTFCKSFSAREREILNHPSFYRQVIVQEPPSSPAWDPPPPYEPASAPSPPPAKSVRFADDATTAATRKRKNIQVVEIKDDDDDDDEDTDLGKKLALADARMFSSTSIYNMALSYCEELERKLEYHKMVTLPQKQRQMMLCKQQRDILVQQVDKRLRTK